MRRNRNAKIIATLGPATESEQSIRTLFEAGADVFRLNFSHGEHADHAARMQSIRKLEKEFQRPIAVLMDLQGPKLRVGVFDDGPVELQEGDSFTLDLDKTSGNSQRVNLPHPEIFAVLRPGAELLLDDGKIRLRVQKCDKTQAQTEVIVGGKLSDRKGVNVPDCVLPISPLTEKDRVDLEFGLSIGADWVALSFVQTPEDVEEALRLVNGRAKVLSKLEKPAAITHLSKIVELSDAVMVARGDLGVELPPEQVPAIQKRIVRNCRMYGKPVVIATQMLESMIQAPTPTRAETTDIATAVYDGVDAVMLSVETAAGKYPQEAVSMMNRIIETVE
ncbi:MAG: pyruvate kinase, partial [Granulosicoccaceae bacterium]